MKKICWKKPKKLINERNFFHVRDTDINDRLISYFELQSRFANGPGNRGSMPGRVIPKTQKIELDSSLLNTRHYKVWIKGKVEQSREKSGALPYILV